MPAKAAYTPPTSDEAVKAKTGKTWPEWFAQLDAEGAKKMSHKEIVAVVRGKYGVGPWWQQQVTVVYEQSRGLRDKHETPAGFQASVSRTFNAPAAEVFKAWKEPRTRARWLNEPGLIVRKATPDKSLRITWADGQTSVDVGLYPKGEAKTQVALQHSKLANATAVKRQKAYWAEALARLKEQLEG
jgi:uncharacterized protein YndB with AHSA1/START domain